jgi:hypothetical protein
MGKAMCPSLAMPGSREGAIEAREYLWIIDAQMTCFSEPKYDTRYERGLRVY